MAEGEKFEIVVNGSKKTWNHERIDYSQAVDLAYPPPHTPTELFTVQYSHGPRENPEGTLVKGHSVKVKNGMEFDVLRTDKS